MGQVTASTRVAEKRTRMVVYGMAIMEKVGAFCVAPPRKRTLKMLSVMQRVRKIDKRE